MKKRSAKHSSKTSTNVTGSKSEKHTEEEEFPGYPLYPAGEDIMNRSKRVDVDINTALENNQPLKDEVSKPNAPNLGTSEKNSDLTSDDFQALASDEIEFTGDDEVLTNRPWPVDFAAEDLDIPGSEEDDAREQIGAEDEENNPYSIGGENHEDLEEDRSGGL